MKIGKGQKNRDLGARRCQGTEGRKQEINPNAGETEGLQKEFHRNVFLCFFF